ncbi:MAG: UDP-N-acetylmuramoyl-L-alanine--D-glutamate ligase, partial [Lachnospiraceae bacterium]|nr:UDP-N-acetylmuramoyl-L-alanine--D-glutamate ligase [Lachnospiraceae bacterium]
MNFENKNVLVYGTGISGISAVSLLEGVQARVILYDENTKLTKEQVKAKLPEDSKAKIVLGVLSEDLIETLDMVVLSPGVPTDIPIVESFKNRGIAVWGEIELAYRLSKGRVVAITGTNGKTTTTTLVGKLMENYFESVFVVGNIGKPYTKAADQMADDTVTVAEISSFQLETVHEFHPVVSAILNITPDHLDRHHTMECYIETKEKIAQNQTKDDVCVLNFDDTVTRDFANNCNASVLYFSRLHKLEKGVYLDGDTFVYSDGETQTEVCKTTDLKVLGGHNHENVMAAIAMAVSMKVPMDIIRKTVTEFTAVEHRIEYVTTKNGVDYYNDSKGTNPDAAIKGIQAMNRKTVLIGGGYDKGSSYDEWIESFDGKVTYLVLLGATKDKIAECARKHGFENIIFVETMEEAVE